MLRWLGRSPESFLPGSNLDLRNTALPHSGPDQRLRWNLRTLYEAIDTQRQERNMTWLQLSRELACTPNQLTGIRKARYAIGMRLAMRVVMWLDRPSSDFITMAQW
jgi:hypothetical protein